MKPEVRRFWQKTIAIIVIIAGIGMCSYFNIVFSGTPWKEWTGFSIGVLVLCGGVLLFTDPMPWFYRRLFGDTSGSKILPTQRQMQKMPMIGKKSEWSPGKDMYIGTSRGCPDILS